MNTDSTTEAKAKRLMGSQCLGQKNEIKREKFLIFSLGDDRFGIPLHTVKEIIGSVEITPIPQVPNFFKGLINLRGDIISVIDLRTKLSIAPSSKLALKKTSIIIVEIEGIKIGTVVDDVDEVVGLEQNQIERSLEIQGNVSSKFVTGVAKQEKQNLVLLLDIGKVLSIDELKMLKGNTNK